MTLRHQNQVLNIKETQPGNSKSAPTRPLRWEDDLSINALDREPFVNAIPLSQWDPADFRLINSGRIPSEISHLEIERLKHAISKDSIPIPCSRDREGYGTDEHNEYYWLSGYRDYYVATVLAEKYGVELQKTLELGAASGRVLRHFACQSDATEVWATELNHRHIRWLSEFMPKQVLPISLPALASLPMEDNYFDAVLAYSVFTHCDIFETGWLAEIRRVLKPGGIALLTAHTESTWAAMQQATTEDPDSLLRFEKAIPNLYELLENPMPEGHTGFRHTQVGPYRGMAFHSISHIENVWGRFMEIEEVIPLGHARQTVIVLQKR